MDADTPSEAKRLKLDSDSDVILADVAELSKNSDNGEPCGCSNVEENNTGTTVFDKPVQEVEVGITEFISTNEGFHGIIKQRYSDFLVNEIDLAGKQVSLAALYNRDVPPCDQVQNPDSVSKLVAIEELSEAVLLKLKQLADSQDRDGQVTIEAGKDKETRTRIHKTIAQEFPQLISRTENVDDTRYIVVTVAVPGDHSGKGGKKDSRQQQWPHKGTDYCRCVLYKENIDTMFAVNIITKYLRIKTNMVTYSGTKDKRAKTCQELSFYRVTASRLNAVNVKLRDMVLGNFRYCSEPLALGDLKGNHFVIVLRSVTDNDEQISMAMKSLKQSGFINYYGMQRFGTTSVPTHQVGRALLKSSWKEAVDLIMKPRTSAKNDHIFEARQCWWQEHDAQKAIKLMGKRTGPERHLLEGLHARNTNDFVGALCCIPRNNRLMYIHAYQSYLWNRLVSYRLREYGLQPIVGDLFIKADLDREINEGFLEDAEQRDPQRKQFMEPTVVTEANIKQLTIHDVVLPLVGYDITYPSNTVGEQYKTWLAEDALSVNDLKHKVKDYALRGAYRHIVICPEDMSWEVIPYEDPNLTLVLSDLERLKGQQLVKPEKGPNKALKLEFSLPSSTYATMAIREVLKQDTSASNQTTLTVAAMTSKSSSVTNSTTEAASSVVINCVPEDT